MNNLAEVNVDYIYTRIPSKYICAYNAVLTMLSEYGEELLKDCKANCTDRNSNVIECFNMFNAAIAAYNLGKEKLADTVIKYIEVKIRQLGVKVTGKLILDIDNGHFKLMVNCPSELSNVKFYIDEDNLHLYEEYEQELENSYKLENGHFVEYENC